MKKVRIGELAKQTRVSVKTLRYYEEIGVLAIAHRSAQGYRDYPDDTVDQVRFIKASQAVGLSLKEIREIIAHRQAGVVPCQQVLALLQKRAYDYQERIDELTQARTTLDQLVARAQELEPQDCLPGEVCHLIPSLSAVTGKDQLSNNRFQPNAR
jgi:DNA-binding transcriptional MerR regulator